MVKENIEACLERLRLAASRVGRSFGDVTLIAVTKGVALPLIYEALDCGIGHVGESRIQETTIKYEPLNQYAQKRNRLIKWHMIGHLQANKVKEAVRFFDLIHSVDSVRLARRIDVEAQKRGKVQDILLQFNVSGESSKFGFSCCSARQVLGQLKNLKNIRVLGFMTIPPLAASLQESRKCFRKLKDLRDAINRDAAYSSAGVSLPVLSFGMTQDFEVAVEEGATMVRIGTAIFGERKK